MKDEELKEARTLVEHQPDRLTGGGLHYMSKLLDEVDRLRNVCDSIGRDVQLAMAQRDMARAERDQVRSVLQKEIGRLTDRVTCLEASAPTAAEADQALRVGRERDLYREALEEIVDAKTIHEAAERAVSTLEVVGEQYKG